MEQILRKQKLGKVLVMTKAINKRKAILTILVLIVAAAFVFTGVDAEAKSKAKEKTKYSIRSMVRDGRKYDLTNNHMKAWLKNYKIGMTQWWGETKEKTQPKKVRLKWLAKGLKPKNYVLLLSTDEEFKDVKRYVTDKNFIYLDNLFTGTEYFWKVYVKEMPKVVSEVYSFKTKKGIRTINLPGVSNVRDLGGKKVPGGTIRQGLLYRSSNMDNITPEGKRIALKDLKLKTEFDLRRTNELQTNGKSPISSKVKYYNLSGTYYKWLWRSELDKYTISQEMRILANRKNYPLDFHCMVGRDRTGTLAYVVGGLLGLSQKELFKDYEMTFFSIDGCKKDGLLTLDDYTRRAQFAIRGINRYGTKKDRFSKKVELFLRDAGVSKKQIWRIKDILIEPKD